MAAEQDHGGGKPTCSLSELVQNLPTELYDEILELTLALDEEVVEIDCDYKPPVQLQISRGIREKMSVKYYSSTIFSIPYKSARDEGKWYRSIPPPISNVIATIRYDWKPQVYDTAVDDEQRLWSMWAQARVLQQYHTAFYNEVYVGADWEDRQMCAAVRWMENEMVQKEWINLEDMRRILAEWGRPLTVP